VAVASTPSAARNGGASTSSGCERAINPVVPSTKAAKYSCLEAVPRVGETTRPSRWVHLLSASMEGLLDECGWSVGGRRMGPSCGARLGWALHRQAHGEGRADPLLRRHQDLPSGCADVAAGDREPEAGAGDRGLAHVLGAVEALAEPFALCLGHPDP